MTIETVEEHPVTEILDFCDGSQQGGILVHYLSVLEKKYQNLKTNQNNYNYICIEITFKNRKLYNFFLSISINSEFLYM